MAIQNAAHAPELVLYPAERGVQSSAGSAGSPPTYSSAGGVGRGSVWGGSSGAERQPQDPEKYRDPFWKRHWPWLLLLLLVCIGAIVGGVVGGLKSKHSSSNTEPLIVTLTPTPGLTSTSGSITSSTPSTSASSTSSSSSNISATSSTSSTSTTAISTTSVIPPVTVTTVTTAPASVVTVVTTSTNPPPTTTSQTCTSGPTAASDGTVYTVYPNTDFGGAADGGNVIQWWQNVVSLGTCIELCESNSGCIAVDWYGPNKATGDHLACALLSETYPGSSGVYGECAASRPLRTMKASDGAVYQVLANTDFMGASDGSNVITYYDNTASLAACIDLCEKVETCAAVDWYGVDRGSNGGANRCYLLSNTNPGKQVSTGEYAAFKQ